MEAVKEALSEGTRPWGEMVERLQPPFGESMEDIAGRVEANLLYYACNYALVVLAVFVYSLTLHPTLLLFVLLTVMLLVLVNSRDLMQQLPPALAAIPRPQRNAAVLLLVALLLTFNGLFFSFLWPFLISNALVLCHATLRPRNLKSSINHIKTKAEKSEIGQGLKDLTREFKKIIE